MTFSQIRQYIKGLLSNIFNKSLSNIAPKFDKTKTYAIGDRVIYNGDLYQFTSAHTGAWTAADANKTDINTLTERMPSGDMEEVASPMPGVMSRLPILFDESGAERVVGWYKYADGTKKPVYRKEFGEYTTSINVGNGVTAPCDTDFNAVNPERVVKASLYLKQAGSHSLFIPCGFWYDGSWQYSAGSGAFAFSNATTYFVLEYTKTTDTAS